MERHAGLHMWNPRLTKITSRRSRLTMLYRVLYVIGRIDFRAKRYKIIIPVCCVADDRRRSVLL